ncbi:MAG: ChaN family lipoprotein [Magnetospirillum sp. WYHS-4]
MLRPSFFALAALALLSTSPAQAGEACVPPGVWRVPGQEKPLAPETLLARMAERPVVLLGESHASADHHRWQFQTLAALHARRSNLVLAFEMFPRRLQPALDAWTRGELDERRFLERVEWNEVWRFDANLYLPLFHFARMNRLPMVAMNVDSALVRETRRIGWARVPSERREGVGDAAPASTAYREGLGEVFQRHGEADAEGLGRFVEAQQVWDRAMAEAIAKVRRGGGEPLVVGIVGQGHLEYGHGIPHQLADLGLPGAAVLLPWDADRDCTDLMGKGGVPIADALFGLPSSPKTEEEERPRLGILVETVEGGVRVGSVQKDSVAEAAGLREGDLIQQAAGRVVIRTDDLIATVRRQAPGTWLPLRIRRGGEGLDIVARFPPKP